MANGDCGLYLKIMLVQDAMGGDKARDEVLRRRRLQNVALLAWPQRLTDIHPLDVETPHCVHKDEKKIQIGYVVGWHLPSSVCGQSCDSVIVLDIIPIVSAIRAGDKSCSLSKKVLLDELERIQSKLRLLRDTECCCCCTCKGQGKVRLDQNYHKNTSSHIAPSFAESACGGCVRKGCFHDHPIDIVAFAVVIDDDDNNSNSRQATRQNLGKKRRIDTYMKMLPEEMNIIEIRTQNGRMLHPLWSDCVDNNANAERNSSEKQLLFYDSTLDIQSDRSAPLYRHVHNNSVLTNQFLILLTHAGAIRKGIQDHLRRGNNMSDVKNYETIDDNVQSDKNLRSDESSDNKYGSHSIDRGVLNGGIWSYIFPHTTTFFNQYMVHRQRTTLERMYCKSFSWFVQSLDECHDGGKYGRSCVKCHQNIRFLPQSHYEYAEMSIQDLNDSIQLFINGFVGIVLGLILAHECVRSKDEVSVMYVYVAYIIQFQYKLFLNGLTWLENNPIGFKLNEQLTSSLGQLIRLYCNIHEHTIRRVVEFYVQIPYVHPFMACVMILISIIFGGSGVLAFVCDIHRIVTIPVTLLDFVFGKILLSELYILSVSWRLFRGKKRNVLRQRTDTMEYDSMQLLVGTIIFAMALFLFTTIFVYYLFFKVFALAALLDSTLIVLPYHVLQEFPFGECIYRARRYGWFSEEIFLLDVPCPNQSWTATNLQQSFKSLFSFVLSCFTSIIRKVLSFNI